MKQKTIYFLFFLSLVFAGYSQNKKSMNPPLKTIMNKGKNKSIHYQTLEIDPVNLFVQDRPFNDRSVHIQLELNSKEADNNFHTFLWYYATGKTPSTNYPQASGKYVYSLDIDKQDVVTFVIEELNFGKEFYITLGEEAILGKLTVKFDESIDVMGASLDGEPHGNESYANYEVLLSENKEEKKISFTSSNLNSQKAQSFKWKNYDVRVLYDDLEILKLVVYLVDAEKK